MRKLLPLVAWVLLCVGLALGQEAKRDKSAGVTLKEIEQRAKKLENSRRFHVRYDRFTNQALVYAGPFQLTGSMRMAVNASALYFYAMFRVPGQTLTATREKLAIRFVSNSKQWLFIEGNRTVYAILDGERETLGQLELLSTEVDRNIASPVIAKEIVQLILPREDIARLAEAKKLEIRVGPFETELKDEHRQVLKDLLLLSEVTE